MFYLYFQLNSTQLNSYCVLDRPVFELCETLLHPELTPWWSFLLADGAHHKKPHSPTHPILDGDQWDQGRNGYTGAGLGSNTFFQIQIQIQVFRFFKYKYKYDDIFFSNTNTNTSIQIQIR